MRRFVLLDHADVDVDRAMSCSITGAECRLLKTGGRKAVVGRFQKYIRTGSNSMVNNLFSKDLPLSIKSSSYLGSLITMLRYSLFNLFACNYRRHIVFLSEATFH